MTPIVGAVLGGAIGSKLPIDSLTKAQKIAILAIAGAILAKATQKDPVNDPPAIEAYRYIDKRRA
jgi:hypothetical protein